MKGSPSSPYFPQLLDNTGEIGKGMAIVISISWPLRGKWTDVNILLTEVTILEKREWTLEPKCREIAIG